MGLLHSSHVFHNNWCVYCRIYFQDAAAEQQCPQIDFNLRIMKRSKFAKKRQHSTHLFGPKHLKNGSYFSVYTCLLCGVTDSTSDVLKPCPKLHEI